MKYARRRDDNEPDIVNALRSVGCSVERLDGDGLPDLLVGVHGRTYLLEVKDVKERKNGTARRQDSIGGRGELRPAQVRFHDSWKGGPVHIVRTVGEALGAVTATNR